MTQYARGAVFERKIAALLAADGYLVIRSAGSHGAGDLVALKPGQVLLIQAKTSGRLDPGEWNGFYAAATGVGALPLLAHRPAPGKVVYWHLTGEKVSRGAAPYVVWTPDEVVA